MSFRATAFDLREYLDAERSRIEAALRRAVAGLGSRVPADLAETAAHAVLGGGKRLRPTLVVEAYRTAGGRGEGAYDLAAAVELVHAYSLVHDDLPSMDAAELRRGRPTTWKARGVERAVRAGALLIPWAHLRAWESARELEGGEEGARRVLSALARAAGSRGMVGGQFLDLRAEEAPPDAEGLETLHRMKTGALLEVSLRVGGIAAGADDAVVGALGGYGEHLGLAFQIADDVLDATADAEALGKNPSDRERGKTTYVGLHGLDGARERARREVGAAAARLDEAGLASEPLAALARFVVERSR